ncbi:LPD7 domain-containing protein [Methylocystis parvus]|uniref:Large polyvalent protein-associated domain-containing protein n=1 Tax=Methylocystis parvus TaxID=134 RepID=A0A6B8MHC3_9HYPH|nr:LPD7 domain-containing protein [Methylocystis parvus]QGN00051.1 hypothetical protein F7D14_20920 [Methylocystis parvus]WBK02450.1 hypothetical protein MMG94_21720 [Methylocystis parvus OBBP]
MAEEMKDNGRAFELKRLVRDGKVDESSERDAERTGDAPDRRAASTARDLAELDSLPAHLRRKYYVVEAGASEAKFYADRGGEYLVAKAGRDRLVTQVASIEIVRDLVAIAAHRGWEKVELIGSLEFRRKAWLAASARGIEAKGYEPTELDRAALGKMQKQSESGDRSLPFKRDRTSAGTPLQRSPSKTAERIEKDGTDDRNARSHLAAIERVALAAFPKDPEARKRVLDAARERMAHHRRRGARFEQAEIGERKGPTREAPVAAKQRRKYVDRAEPHRGDR